MISGTHACRLIQSIETTPELAALCKNKTP